MTGVEKIEEFMREQTLKWFGQVERMDDETTSYKGKNSVVNGSKKGRPKRMERSSQKIACWLQA